MGLLDTTSRGSRFASSLRGELLARGFATSALKMRLVTNIRSDDECDLPCEQFAWYEPLRWMFGFDEVMKSWMKFWNED
jgi:hypothetical protein